MKKAISSTWNAIACEPRFMLTVRPFSSRRSPLQFHYPSWIHRCITRTYFLRIAHALLPFMSVEVLLESRRLKIYVKHTYMTKNIFCQFYMLILLIRWYMQLLKLCVNENFPCSLVHKTHDTIRESQQSSE